MNSITFHARAALILLITISAAIVGHSQAVPEPNGEESRHVNLDARKMKAVVGHILRAEFARKKGTKRVEIYDPGEVGSGFSDLDEAWLPRLPGIQFSLVSEDELQRRGRSGKIDVYFFTKPRISEGRYKIGFGHGDPSCSYVGGNWTFNMIGTVRVIRMNSGFGAGCGNGSGN